MRAGERGRSLVARILAFSRGGSRVHTPLVLEPVVIEALDLLAASLRPGVQLERELHAHDAVVVLRWMNPEQTAGFTRRIAAVLTAQEVTSLPPS